MTPDRPTVCADPECAQVAEPEQDGDLHYWACTGCGYTFGFTYHAGAPAEHCAVGVPEPVRRAASAPMESALGAQHGPLLSIRPR